MKKYILLAFSIFCLVNTSLAQTYLPIATTGYNLDAVAENMPSTSTTGGAIDGSNYVMYSVAYGLMVGGGTTYGLPNSGLISSGTRTYQLQPYTGNNTLYLPASQADTLLVTTPAPYPVISLVGLATEGTGLMTIKLRFGDGTSQTFSNIMIDDWFAASPINTPVLTGFDRASRTSGTPSYNGANPKMCRIDLNIGCANRLKNLAKVIVQNNGTPRLCIMGVSGGISATYSTTTSPVTCIGGTNGSASLTVSNGLPPFTYSWSTTPVQTSPMANLPAGTSSYTVTDASGCAYSSTVFISQNILPSSPLNITASQNPVCSGSSLTLTTSGASTYTWSNNASANTTTITVTSTSSYSVVGTTSANCTLTGNITVTTNPLPVLTFTSVPAKLCLSSPGVSLTAGPAGGSFYGPGISFGNFYPSIAGAGTQTLMYRYTDQNACTSEITISTTISTPTTSISFAITPTSLCMNGPNVALNATPAGGTYTGTGVVGSSFSPAVAGVGAFNITYSYTDANNCTASKVSSVFTNICFFEGFKEAVRELNYELYPNPNNGSFNLKTDADLDLEILNNLGQTVGKLKLDATNNHHVFVENLLEGIYFLSSKEHSFNNKIVVTR